MAWCLMALHHERVPLLILPINDIQETTLYISKRNTLAIYLTGTYVGNYILKWQSAFSEADELTCLSLSWCWLNILCTNQHTYWHILSKIHITRAIKPCYNIWYDIVIYKSDYLQCIPMPHRWAIIGVRIGWWVDVGVRGVGVEKNDGVIRRFDCLCRKPICIGLWILYTQCHCNLC